MLLFLLGGPMRPILLVLHGCAVRSMHAELLSCQYQFFFLDGTRLNFDPTP